MASLYPAAGAPATFDPRVFSTTHNPFLNAEPTSVIAAPALPPLDLAAPLAESVEVTVLWGQSILAVSELSPPRRFTVGEIGGSADGGVSPAGDVDFALAPERLGSERRELVALRGGAPFAIFFGEVPRVLERGLVVDAMSGVVECPDVALGARGIELRQGRVVILEVAGLSFRIAGGEQNERVPRALLGSTDRSAIVTMSTAALLQGLFVACLAYLTPSLAWGDESELDRDRLEMLQQYLRASAAREEEERPRDATPGGGEKGAPAERNAGPEGKAGSPSAKQAGRMAIKGESAERVATRAELIKEASDFGTIGLLNALNASSAPSSPWGAELATGPDNVDAVGDLFSPNIGEGAGNGGLGLSGGGLGGGGKGVGVGMGNIGTCMGLNCYGNGSDGFARSLGRSGGEHKLHSFRVRPEGTSVVSGRLPPDVIQRIVRQNFGRFRSCYEVGLRTNPNLEGRVVARFVIGRDGAVSNVSASGDLPDSQVRSCVASAFYGLSFPTPEGGIVTVSYPILLTPS